MASPNSLDTPLPPPSSDTPLTPPNATTTATANNPASFNRLSQPFLLRLPLLTTTTYLAGAFLGLRQGATEASFRFRAEHAHRMPATQAGWYLYHKSKNYHIALGGISEGFRMGWRMAPWAGVFVVLEESVDRGRAAVVREWRSHVRDVHVDVDVDEEVAGVVEGVGNKDFVSTMLAGLCTAGVFAAWKAMPLPTAVRLMKMGAKVGVGYGLAQDLLNWVQGRRLGYVEFVKRHTVGTGDKGVEDARVNAAAAAAAG